MVKNQQFLIILESSINISLLKFSDFLTPEKLAQLEKKIYYQYKLIEPFVQNYLQTLSDNILKFTNYLNSTSSYYEPIFIKLNSTITSIYDELSYIINDKYDIINQGLNLRNLGSIKDKIEKSFGLSIILTYSIVDLDLSIEIEIMNPLKLKFGTNFFLGFGLEYGIEEIFTGNKQNYIDLYGQVSSSIYGEVGVYYGKGPFELGAGGGIDFLLASRKVGIKYEFNRKEKKDRFSIYLEFNSFELKAYIYIEVKILEFSLRIELFSVILKGFKCTIEFQKLVPIINANTNNFIIKLMNIE